MLSCLVLSFQQPTDRDQSPGYSENMRDSNMETREVVANKANDKSPGPDRDGGSGSEEDTNGSNRGYNMEGPENRSVPRCMAALGLVDECDFMLEWLATCHPSFWHPVLQLAVVFDRCIHFLGRLFIRSHSLGMAMLDAAFQILQMLTSFALYPCTQAQQGSWPWPQLWRGSGLQSHELWQWQRQLWQWQWLLTRQWERLFPWQRERILPGRPGSSDLIFT